jgi:hypothetical protein
MNFNVKNYEKTLNNQFSLNIERCRLGGGGLGIAQLFISKILSPRNYYSEFLEILEVFEKELEGRFQSLQK